MALKDLGHKPRQVSVRIVFNDQLRLDLDAALAELNAQKRSAEGTGLSKVNEAVKAVETAKAAFDKGAVSFTFQALNRTKLRDLTEAHKPTVEQLEKWKDQDRLRGLAPPAWNIDTFPPCLIAASLVEPEISEAELVEMWESEEPDAWSEAIWDVLWVTAWDKANRQVDTRPTSGTGTS